MVAGRAKARLTVAPVASSMARTPGAAMATFKDAAVRLAGTSKE